MPDSPFSRIILLGHTGYIGRTHPDRSSRCSSRMTRS
jgi:hypothetical protein